MRAHGATVLGNLFDLLFIGAVRRCTETPREDEKGWLAGRRERFVGRALSLLHARPARPSTGDALGREAGLSRRARAQRFTGLLGQPPMQYLAQWRLQLAARRLRGGDVPLPPLRKARVMHRTRRSTARGSASSAYRRSRGGARAEDASAAD